MTLSYELCAKLKAAGFSQKSTYEAFNCSCGKQVFSNGTFVSDSNSYEFVKQPTLSELIEACGEDFGLLIKEKNGWQAQKHFYGDGLVCLQADHVGFGETPEEAVCRLWICLNSDTIKK